MCESISYIVSGVLSIGRWAECESISPDDVRTLTGRLSFARTLWEGAAVHLTNTQTETCTTYT